MNWFFKSGQKLCCFVRLFAAYRLFVLFALTTDVKFAALTGEIAYRWFNKSVMFPGRVSRH